MTNAVIHSHFISPGNGSLISHASTIAETSRGLVCAFFAGSDEGRCDVAIWVSRHDGCAWSSPEPVADGQTNGGERLPCWNPVLHHTSAGELLLFYKIGPDCAHWRGMLKRSRDGGVTWSVPESLPDGLVGPSKNKPLALTDGTLLCPSSTELGGWRVHLERSTQDGRRWARGPDLNEAGAIAAIQPTLIPHRGGRLQLLCRTQQGYIAESWSADRGNSWSPLCLISLPNPCSGIDAVALSDGRIVLVYNHTHRRPGTWRPRSPLNVAVSDDGRAWRALSVLESSSGEYSYPAVIQTRDGYIHITYTWRRAAIRHVVLDIAGLD